MKFRYGTIPFALALLLAGCEQLGIETPATEQAREEAEGKAIGSACRQAARALEDCYVANRKASKAAIFAGWREMDAYMRENKIEEIKPDGAKAASTEKARPAEAVEEPGATSPKGAAAKPVAGSEEKAAAKPAQTAPARGAKTPI